MNEDARTAVEHRALRRAQHRRLGAAFDREIPRSPDEPFMASFVVTDGRRTLDLLVLFPEEPRLSQPLSRKHEQWVLERAVEDELLAHSSLRWQDLEALAAKAGYVMVVGELLR